MIQWLRGQLVFRGRPRITMNLVTVVGGGLIVFLTAVAIVVALPLASFDPDPSARARPLTALEQRGRELYQQNGCWYCHSQTNRPQDINVPGLTSARTDRPSEAGDWAFVKPALLGSERVGPDLAQIGGVLIDDWHRAHFVNARYTSPNSLMPNHEWLEDQNVTLTDEQGQEQEVTAMDALIAYTQSLGGKDADVRGAVQEAFGRLKRGEITSVEDDLDQIPDAGIRERAKALAAERQQIVTDWAEVTTNPLPLNESALALGKKTFFGNCIGCHGTKGDGNGPAAEYLTPRPADFTVEARHQQISPGTFYETIFSGRLGTAMHPFGNRLTVEQIWSVDWFLRSIPNGGAEHVPVPGMVVRFDPAAAEAPTPTTTPAGTATPAATATPGATGTPAAEGTPTATGTPAATTREMPPPLWPLHGLIAYIDSVLGEQVRSLALEAPWVLALEP